MSFSRRVASRTSTAASRRCRTSTSRSSAARWSGWSATTAPASRRSSRSSAARCVRRQGSLFVDGEEVSFHSPRESRDKGIEVVYQDLALATELSIAENIFLGRETRRRGFMGRRCGCSTAPRWRAEAGKALATLGIGISDVRARTGLLSGGERQAVAVARAVTWGQKVLLLDEPTAALAVVEQRKIEDLVRQVRKQDVGVILVSHNLRQVSELCDRVHVLLHGRVAGVLPKQDATPRGARALDHRRRGRERPRHPRGGHRGRAPSGGVSAR